MSRSPTRAVSTTVPFSLLAGMALACPVLACPVLFGIVAADRTAVAADPEDSFVPIFDGTSLDGWEGRPEFWRVEAGSIVGETTPDNPTKGNTFLIWRDGLVDDFELRLAYRLTGGNSGIQYRSRDLGDFVVGGYQADFESGTKYSGILYEEKGRGILALRGQRTFIGPDGTKGSGGMIGLPEELQQAIRQDGWNDYRIVARGPRLQHFINGQLMSETVDTQPQARAEQGVLALQVHAGPPMKVEFRDIRLKRLRFNDGRKKLVMIAGKPSHPAGEHEHRAGVLLVKKCLDEAFPAVVSAVYTDGWPRDPTAFDNADAIFMFADGGQGHPVVQSNRLAQLDALARRGVGLAFLHYAVEVPKDQGGAEFLDWMGGYFETHWSVNPHWTLARTALAEGHPITRGVTPFELQDEWYYHMRFRDPPIGLTEILTAVPPDSTRERPDGPHSNNPTVRANRGGREVLAWACDRLDGGRGFGCTGGHFHRNWGDDDFRRLMLNALVWTTGLDVPAGGVTAMVTADDLAVNLDPDKKPRAKPVPAAPAVPPTGQAAPEPVGAGS